MKGKIWNKKKINGKAKKKRGKSNKDELEVKTKTRNIIRKERENVV